MKRDLEGGQMSRDMTLYVDDDGIAYHIYSSEENLTLQIAELTDDYQGHSGKYVRLFPGDTMRHPAIFKKDSTYWMITSGCTGWAPNAARLFSAPSIWGPWTQHPNPCRGEGSDKTFGGQSTYVLQLPGNRYLFMADIWRPRAPDVFGISLDSVRFDEEGCSLILPFPANAIRQMVVDKPRSLQMGIANGRAEELESPFFMSLLMASDSGDDTGISLND